MELDLSILRHLISEEVKNLIEQDRIDPQQAAQSLATTLARFQGAGLNIDSIFNDAKQIVARSSGAQAPANRSEITEMGCGDMKSIDMSIDPTHPEEDHEGSMAKRQMFKTAEYAAEIFDNIQDDDEFPAWIQSKMTKIADYIGAVKHYLEYDHVIGVPGNRDDYLSESKSGRRRRRRRRRWAEDLGIYEFLGDQGLEEFFSSVMERCFDDKGCRNAPDVMARQLLEHMKKSSKPRVQAMAAVIEKKENKQLFRGLAGYIHFLQKSHFDPPGGADAPAKLAAVLDAAEKIASSPRVGTGPEPGNRSDKKWSDADHDKQEKIAKEIEKDNPGISKQKKMAFAGAQVNREKRKRNK